ncbi:hypothetical protein UK12_33675 [Saccharothrix sp. ST-888]|nr:hypothetical protein UK12_33675 [Saccharothrix sp. ST-888]
MAVGGVLAAAAGGVFDGTQQATQTRVGAVQDRAGEGGPAVVRGSWGGEAEQGGSAGCLGALSGREV